MMGRMGWKMTGSYVRILVWACVLGTATLGLWPLLANKDRALVQSLRGKARIYDDASKKWKPLQIGQVVPDSSWVETAPQSQLVIFYRGSEVRLAAGTKLKINNLSNESKPGDVHVSKGFSWYRVNKRPFTVSSPTAIASVRGTKFAVVHDATGTATCVCEGEVGVRKAAAGSTEEGVVKGYSADFDAKGNPQNKDFRKYFRGLKVDRSFQSQILADQKMNGCKNCHRMTNLATDNSPDPKSY